MIRIQAPETPRGRARICRRATAELEIETDMLQVLSTNNQGELECTWTLSPAPGRFPCLHSVAETAGERGNLPVERGTALFDDPEDAPHERVDPAEERIGAWRQIRRRAPVELAGGGGTEAELPGVV